MSNPLMDASDLGTYLGDDSIDVARAEMILFDAQSACETVVNPVPPGKLFVLRRVAVRAYTSGSGQSHNYQLGQADSDYAGGAPISGVYLTRFDREDLLGDDEQGAPEAFTLHTSMPVAQWNYTAPFVGPFWGGGYG